MTENKTQLPEPVPPAKKTTVYRKQFCVTPVLNSRMLKAEKQTGIKESNIITIAVELYLTSKNF